MLHLRHPTPLTNRLAGTEIRACPLCAGDVLRTARRPVDRVAGWISSTRRYRCQSFRCQWEGNLQRQRSAFRKTTRYNSLRGLGAETEPADRSLPKTFIVSMVLSVLGTVFVLVAGSTDWMFPADPAYLQSSEDSWRAQPVFVTRSPSATAPAVK